MVFFPEAKAPRAGGILDHAYHTQLYQNEKKKQLSKRHLNATSMGPPGGAGSPLKSTTKQGS